MFNNKEFKEMVSSTQESENKIISPPPEIQAEEKKTEPALPPSDNQNNSKFSTILLILLFIFLFAFVMFMPNIQEMVEEYQSNRKISHIKEESTDKKKPQSTTPTPTATATQQPDLLKQMTCTSLKQNQTENYTLIQIQKFTYNANKQIISSSDTYNYQFVTVDEDYNKLKQQCQNNSEKYIARAGYTPFCNYEETEITISHEFDLKTYTTIVDGIVSIKANAAYQQDVDTIKKELESKSYTCTEN